MMKLCGWLQMKIARVSNIKWYLGAVGVGFDEAIKVVNGFTDVLKLSTFWYLSKYVSLPYSSSVGTRGFHLFKELSALGHNCVIITSDSNMLTKSPVVQGRILDQRIDGVQVRWIKTFKYIKARSLRRIFSWLDFEVKVLLFGSKGLPAPEAVVVSSLSLLTILNGFLLRRKFGCKIIFEVRDIWPLTLIVEGNFSKFNPLVIALGFIEYLGYKFSDEISWHDAKFETTCR